MRAVHVLLVDNYDSFTWNLAALLERHGAEVTVRRNDAVDAREAAAGGFRAIVISPGPGTPDRAGSSVAIVRALAGTLPILGVCLGQQAIAVAFGGRLAPAPTLVHGKTSAVHHDDRGVFRGLPRPFSATRYHSWVVERESLPDRFVVSAWTEDGTIMGIRDRECAVEGVQFHPESILTPFGGDLVANFLAAVPQGAARGTA